MKSYTSNKTQQFAEAAPVFSVDAKREMGLIKLYPDVTFQEYLGMGGAFTEASAVVFSQMSAPQQERLLELYFGENGNRYGLCRTHIQSCDFSLGNYAYLDDPADTELRSFSIARDRQYLIPLIRAAKEKAPGLSLLASPWSPPAFMKTNGDMNHGGALKREYYDMWARMIAKYVTAYGQEGLEISRLTVQNEPNAVQTWDSCLFSGTEEAEFACGYLRPALDAAGLKTVKIHVWDHNKDRVLDRAMESFSRGPLDGIAFHWYSGDHFEALQETARRFPEKELIFTEGCVEYSRYAADDAVAHAEKYAHDLIGNFNAGMQGFIDWNLYLNAEGGPNHVGNFCDAPILCHTDEDEISVHLSYYYLGHFSRFLRPGARRILVSRYTDRLEAAGFVNPDGERVLVLLNRTEDALPYGLCEGDHVCDGVLPGHSIRTVCW